MGPSVTFRHPNLPNLKSNILVDNDSHARLSGFSLLTMASDELTATFLFRERDTSLWMSPELLYPRKFGLEEPRPTKESDCYALGITIYEVLRREVQFGASELPVFMAIILREMRPMRPRGKEGEPFTDDIWDILELCLKEQPRDRISASAVLLRLEKHPPLPMPSSDVGGDAESGSDDSDESVIDSMASDCTFSMLHSRLIFDLPCVV